MKIFDLFKTNKEPEIIIPDVVVPFTPQQVLTKLRLKGVFYHYDTLKSLLGKPYYGMTNKQIIEKLKEVNRLEEFIDTYIRIVLMRVKSDYSEKTMGAFSGGKLIGWINDEEVDMMEKYKRKTIYAKVYNGSFKFMDGKKLKECQQCPTVDIYITGKPL